MVFDFGYCGFIENSWSVIQCDNQVTIITIDCHCDRTKLASISKNDKNGALVENGACHVLVNVCA